MTGEETLPVEPTTLCYYLEVKDGGIVQTYPGTAFEKRRKHVPHEMNIKDMRSIKDQFTLDKNGFELIDNVFKEKEFLDQGQILESFYPEVQALMKKMYVAALDKMPCDSLMLLTSA